MQTDGRGPQTSHQFVRDRLRRAIVRGELASGTRLLQGEIAKEYGVSTTPVREALRDLAAEGLIRFDAHRGALVHEMESHEFGEIYEMRLVLEPLAVRRSIERIGDADIDRAATIQTEAEKKLDPGQWVELNRELHAVFIDAARSERLSLVLKQLRDSSALYVGFVVRSHPAHMAQANQEHWQLIEAFRRRDVDAAVEVTLAHLQGTHHLGTGALPHAG